MHISLFHVILAVLICITPLSTNAEGAVIENFEQHPESRWRFFTDGVMGGISTGQVAFAQEGGRTYARMTGSVSTANNGGFIQMRMDLPDGAPENAVGVRLVARGNNQRYFVHLRTTGTVLPWQYYQMGFKVTAEWAEIRLPFDAFQRSGQMLRAIPRGSKIASLAVVAFGRDHKADIQVREIGFY